MTCTLPGVIEAYKNGEIQLWHCGGTVEARMPSGAFVSPETRKTVRAHRYELIALLKWEQEADELVGQSIARLEAQWPVGCDTSGPDCSQYDSEVREAIEEGDRVRLQTVLKAREYRVKAWLEARAGGRPGQAWRIASALRSRQWPKRASRRAST